MGKATRWFKGLFGMKKEDLNSPVSDQKEKKRWSFTKSSKDCNEVKKTPAIFPANFPTKFDIRSYITETEKEQNKHAIAVAAATAAAADAAVAAAQAAVAVVRLTSNGRGTLFSGGRERWAVVKIQTIFRGFLARKALKALKALVKLQALVRGFLVRKKTTATLYSMQALIRAQNSVRAQRARRSITKENRFKSEFQSRKSIERIDESISEFHSKRRSVYYESPMNGFEGDKIVEIDTFKPKSRSRRFNTTIPDYYLETISSPLPFPIPDSRYFNEFEWNNFMADECKFSTAQSTPRFTIYSKPPVTPAKSVSGERPYSAYPSYMANTKSFKAKLRSHSAPKQRPEIMEMKKRGSSLEEIMAARNSVCSVRMDRSSFRGDEGLNS